MTLALPVLLLVIAGTTAFAGPAHHPTPPPPSPTTIAFDGTLTGNGLLAGPACGPDLPITNDGTLTLASGATGTFHFEYCVTAFDPDVVDAPVYGGTFAIVTPTGTLDGTVTGSSQSANQTPDGFPTHLVLTVASGTGAFTGATGTVVFDGFLGLGAGSIDGSFTGSVTVPGGPAVNLPTRLRDCLGSRWATHTDDLGRPFTSRHECIVWLLHHRHHRDG